MIARTIVVCLTAAIGACNTSDSADHAAANERSNTRKPNVIYILADDLGYGDIGAYGQQYAKTPVLDQLAREGMMFTQHYAGSSVCAPSRAVLMTGQHTGHAQIRGNYGLGGFLDEEERGQLPLRAGTKTLGTVMQEAGYRTAAIGKWGLGGPGGEGAPNKQGFDFFFGYLDQKQAHSYYPTHLWRNDEIAPLDNDYIYPHQAHEGDPADPASYEKYKGRDYAPDRLTDEALSFIDRAQGEPFFLYLAYTAPHAALQVPDEQLAQYDGAFEDEPYLGTGSNPPSYTSHMRRRAARAGMISHMDADIGKVLARLEARGLSQDTLVIFTSDNGPAYEGGGDLDFFNATAGLRGTKRDLYEGGIRVPMIAWWPGKIAAGARSDAVSAFWDVMPTFQALVGADGEASQDGVSFLPVLFGEVEDRNAPLYWEFHEKWRGAEGAQAVRIGRWKAVRRNGRADPDAPTELYNLDSDPAEQNDIAAEHPEIVARAVAVMNARTQSPIEKWNTTEAKP